MENDDICEEFDSFISAGAKYKAMKESFKIDFDAVRKEIEIDELLKKKEIEIEKEQDKPKKYSKLEKKKISSSENGKATDKEGMAESETNNGWSQRTRRGRKRNSDVVNEEAQEKQIHILNDSPICIPDSPICSSNAADDLIYISSDDESNLCLDVSLPEEDLNYEMSVKVWWKFDRFDKFNIRRFQKLACLFEHYTKLESVSQDQILLTLNDVTIHPNDTPDSLKLTVANIIEGGITSSKDSSRPNALSKQQEPTLSKDELELKVQRKGSKEPLVIRILKTQKMKIFMLKCAESLELPIEKLKFSFDGDTVNCSDTPVGLDLEGGECIDLHILE